MHRLSSEDFKYTELKNGIEPFRIYGWVHTEVKGKFGRVEEGLYGCIVVVVLIQQTI